MRSGLGRLDFIQSRSSTTTFLPPSSLPSSAMDDITIILRTFICKNLPSKAMQTTLPLQIPTTKTLTSTYICKWTYRESGASRDQSCKGYAEDPDTFPLPTKTFPISFLIRYIHCAHTPHTTHDFFKSNATMVLKAASSPIWSTILMRISRGQSTIFQPKE